MSTIVNIEYIGARRDPDYAKKIGCVEGTRELSLTFNKPVFKKATGKDRDLKDDTKTLIPVEVRVSVPHGKSIKINNILYNFIPETDYQCEVADPIAIGRLLSHSSLFRKVEDKKEEEPIVRVKYEVRERPPRRKKTIKRDVPKDKRARLTPKLDDAKAMIEQA